MSRRDDGDGLLWVSLICAVGGVFAFLSHYVG